MIGLFNVEGASAAPRTGSVIHQNVCTNVSLWPPSVHLSKGHPTNCKSRSKSHRQQTNETSILMVIRSNQVPDTACCHAGALVRHLSVSQAKYHGLVLQVTPSFTLSPPPPACPMQNSILDHPWDTLRFCTVCIRSEEHTSELQSPC